jgi:hypothetical protein
VKAHYPWMVSAVVTLILVGGPVLAADAPELAPPAPKIDSDDTAWTLASSAWVMFMMPGLALYCGGMVRRRRKSVLATMMQAMVALSIPAFRAVYPYVTTVRSNRFRRRGDPAVIRESLQQLLETWPHARVRARMLS